MVGPRRFASPAEAEAAFYAAFEAMDLAAMAAVWSHAEDVTCIHPMGHAIHGWPALEQSWARIFQGLGQARFVLSDLREFAQPSLSVRFVHENIHHGPGFTGISRVLATNVFRLEDRGWRLISHHASPGGVLREPDADTGGQARH